MFTNFLQYIFNSAMGNHGDAMRNELLMRMTWNIDRDQAIMDMVTGGASCVVGLAVVAVVAIKINKSLAK